MSSAGPSTPAPLNPRPRPSLSALAKREGQEDEKQGSLWEEILGVADKQKGLRRKNVIFLYAVPPLSVFYPPSSHPNILKLVSTALPPKSLSDTAVVIALDWTKPSSMVQELLTWLSWVEQWAQGFAEQGEVDELHEKLQSYLQHYSEPSANSSTSAYANLGPLLPLGPGTLTLNSAGIPIIVICTKADLMDSVGEEIGIKGGGWEERTDWVQQVLRTICLSYGAALFYTASTQPSTYSILKEYLLHRLYTVPPPLHATSSSPTNPTHPTSSLENTKFPFNHRANVLDRDAVMVPSGWDSWGKIKVLREGFEVEGVKKSWEVSLRRFKSQGQQQDMVDEDGEEGLEGLWAGMIPDTSRAPHHTSPTLTTQTEPEQSFLARHLEALLKDPQRDPRQSFRHAATVIGPMGGSEGLSLPGVEKAMKEMEGSDNTAKDAEGLKEKFAKLGKRDGKANGPLSPSTPGSVGGTTPPMPNEALHNFFQGLLANRGKTATPTHNKPAESR
nr:dynein light intermediate chain 1, cytosolic [Cryptococcus depauperatus CBS 7841]